jgi:hypothetical protein
MISRSLQRLGGATLAAIAFTFTATPSSAATVEVSYLPPIVGIEMLYRGMGYSADDGSFVSLAGATITSATVLVDFTMLGDIDASSFHMDMAVPVSGATSQFFQVTGADLTEVSPNHYTYALTTDDFDGEIFDSRFAVETYGVDSDGNAVGMPALVDASTGFYFTVDVPTAPVPEPSSALLLLGGLAFVAPVLARRRKA